MNIHFYSISEAGKINYRSDGDYKNGVYVFNDKASLNTINHVEIRSDEHITWKRTGSVDSTMEFILNKETKNTYKDITGIEFDLLIETTLIEVLDNKIKLVYKYYVDGSYVDEMRIYLLIKN